MQLQRAGLMFLLSLASGTCAEASPAPPSALNMAPDVRQLFQAEMRELLMGTQSIGITSGRQLGEYHQVRPDHA